MGFMETGMAVSHVTFGFGVVKETTADRVTALFQSGLKTILRDYLKPAEHNVTTKTLGCIGTPARITHVPAEAFVAYLQEVGFTLVVQIYKEEQLDRVREEYRNWTGGAELPDSCIYEYCNRESIFSREWRIRCPYAEEMPSCEPIMEGGTIGRGNISDSPHGLRYGNYVMFNYSSTVEELVRAGLRAYGVVV